MAKGDQEPKGLDETRKQNNKNEKKADENSKARKKNLSPSANGDTTQRKATGNAKVSQPSTSTVQRASAALSGRNPPNLEQSVNVLASNMMKLTEEIKIMKQMPQQPAFYPNYFGEEGPEWADYGPAEGYDDDDYFGDAPHSACNDSPDVVYSGMTDTASSSKQVDNTEVSIHEALQEEELAVYDKYLAEYDAEKHDICDAIPDKLAKGVNSLFTKGLEYDKFKQKAASIHRPENCQALTTVDVDNIVWRLLKPNTKAFDKRVQVVQTAMAKASCNIVKMVDLLQKREDTTANDDDETENFRQFREQLMSLGMGSLALLGHGFHNLCLRRRELQKADVAWKYAPLFSPDVPHNQWLYGGDSHVEKLIKDIGTSNALKMKKAIPYPQRGFAMRHRGGMMRNHRMHPYRRGGQGAGGGYAMTRNYGYQSHARGMSMRGKPKTAPSTITKGEPDWSSAEEASARRGESHCSSTNVENTTVVSSVSRHVDKTPCPPAAEGQSLDISSQQGQSASVTEETSPDSRTVLGKAYRKAKLSERATKIMLSSWKPNTHKQYSVYIRQLHSFCSQRQVNCVKPPIDAVVDFLAMLYYDKGLSYSAINTARSALSQFIIYKGHCTIGSHPYVIRFLKGVFNLRPPTPRYQDTWDVSVVLKLLNTLSPVRKLSLKMLTLKVVTLIGILTAARAQTLVCLNISRMSKTKSRIVFQLGSSDLKQSRPGYTPSPVELAAYPVNRALCVCTALKEYLNRTEPLRGDESQLLISYMKPHKKVGSATVGHWVKTTMAKAGIDTTVYKPHSIRSASVSNAASTAGVPLQQILQTAGWTNAGTFARFYRKKISCKPTMGEKVLDTHK
ncbi:uncharacterized protein [Amphiura filiformis]|uniref:uncharacterized protein n=1 Tax=Amphiura filiformis TaxID=82378 RepID=UPI003B20E0AD